MPHLIPHLITHLSGRVGFRHSFRHICGGPTARQIRPPGRIAGDMPGGRRSFITTDAAPWYDAGQRLRPPEHLGPIEKQAFVDLTSRVPAAQFVEADLPLICRWCELELQAQTAAAELRAHGMVIKDKPSPWIAIHAQALKGQSLLALRLRLGPQSRAPRAPKSMPAHMSAMERLLLEDDDDEAEQH